MRWDQSKFLKWKNKNKIIFFRDCFKYIMQLNLCTCCTCASDWSNGSSRKGRALCKSRSLEYIYNQIRTACYDSRVLFQFFHITYFGNRWANGSARSRCRLSTRLHSLGHAQNGGTGTLYNIFVILHIWNMWIWIIIVDFFDFSRKKKSDEYFRLILLESMRLIYGSRALKYHLLDQECAHVSV